MTCEQFESWNLILLIGCIAVIMLPIVTLGAIELILTVADWAADWVQK